MRKIVVGAFVSLDGVVQAPGGPEEDPTGGFELGGWATAFFDDVVGAAMGESFAEPFDLLLGRKTYDIFAAHWPYVERDPKANAFDKLNVDIANRFDEITKYVATHRADSLRWKNSMSLGADPVATLRALKKGDGPRLLTQGSERARSSLVRERSRRRASARAHADRARRGKRLFSGGSIPGAYEVTKTTPAPSGGRT